jgi:Tfp pilus assembly protein PilF
MSAPLVHLSDALFPLLESRRDYKGMANILAQTNYAASVNSDYMGQAASLCRLGEIAIKQGESIRARSYFDQAITIAHSADLRELENNALTQIEFLSER